MNWRSPSSIWSYRSMSSASAGMAASPTLYVAKARVAQSGMPRPRHYDSAILRFGLSSVMAGLVPAIHAFPRATKTWMPGPSPRRSGFGRAGGTSPGMTTEFADGASLRYFVHHHLVGDAAQRGVLLDRLEVLPRQDAGDLRGLDHGRGDVDLL